MSDDEGDLFADSDDTAELISSSKKPAAAAKKKLGGAAKRKRAANVPDADDDDDEDLFDSDDEGKKPAATKKPKKAAMSKKERMEALQKRKRAASGQDVVSAVPSEKKSKADKGGGDNSDEDSYNSGNFQLTEDDRNFIDTDGDDAAAIDELYAEQHFDDIRAEAMEDNEGGRKKKGGGGGGRSSGGGSRSRSEKLDTGDLDNPIMAAVHRMKKKKAEKRTLTELEEEMKPFLESMERAAEEDELAIKERRPATKKLKMLGSVVEMFTKREHTRVILDLDVLSICARWIKPLPNGSLGNVTVRSRLIDSVESMNGVEGGITPTDLKRSEFGKVVMGLFMHKQETTSMKRKLKKLIELWSRPIFQKSSNMRDLERAGVRGGNGLAQAYARNAREKKMQEAAAAGGGGGGRQSIDSMIKSGKGKAADGGTNRVRIPYSTGFQYSVRPNARVVQTPEKGGKSTEGRDKLKKKMLEKGRAVSKTNRSANISVEGRATK